MRIIALLFAALLVTPAFADELPRKIDFAKVLTGPDGPFRDCKKSDDGGKCTEYADMTLGRLCITASAFPERGLSPSEVNAHGYLGFRLADLMARVGPKEMALSAEDIALLKAMIPKLGYNNIVIYQAMKLLDPVDK